MMFSRTSQRANPNINKNTSYQIPIKYYTRPQPVKVKPPVVVNRPSTSAMRWGKPTWYVLHMMAQRVKEEEFTKIREGLLKIIYNICTNLPCPNCSHHAKLHLDKINFNNIQKKEDLIKVLFSFHNIVNERKGFPIFQEQELVMYKNINIPLCIQMFLQYFSDKSGSYKLMANDLHRLRIIQDVKIWLKDNIIYFE